MPRFTYQAMNDKGVEVSGAVVADNTVTAINQIRDMGYFPTNVDEDHEGEGVGAALKKKGKGLQFEINFLTPKTVRSKVLAIFTRQLATLIDAGLPLLRCLHVLGQQQKAGALKNALGGIADMVESGSTFSEALAAYPRVFNKLFVNMVKAGEMGGVLEIVLNRLAEFVEKSEKLKSKVKSAMIYPIAVITVAIVVVSLLMVYVVPKFTEVVEGFDIDMPTITVSLINTSTWIKNNAYYDHFPYLGMLVLIPVGIIILLKLLAKTQGGKMAIDVAKINMPLFGTLVRKVAVARFARTLGTLITSGVPILQALNIVRDTSGNEVVARAIGNVHDSIREGESVVAPLRDTKVFTPMLISMMEVGEETGRLPDMLIRIADSYDTDVDTAVEGITSIIEPVLIIFLAVVVGFIVIALFLPLIELMKGI
ncbi:MAG: type II secretion system F family protein [Thermoplasmata archaeon]|nr:type II secretion system F family protein [Thermoplasmata archaeon]